MQFQMFLTTSDTFVELFISVRWAEDGGGFEEEVLSSGSLPLTSATIWWWWNERRENGWVKVAWKKESKNPEAFFPLTYPQVKKDILFQLWPQPLCLLVLAWIGYENRRIFCLWFEITELRFLWKQLWELVRMTQITLKFEYYSKQSWIKFR